ncbi:hypothetical protein B1729_00670 [Microbacterium sp. B35-04]|uniref:helix-turn-helix transcriptional regulator n=1 Tax=Microbacterium sp. B35-04 TaxID=1961716 RepID=UPI0013D885BD|nr:LuxR C-terminal-related transcriptional regulator [Microbacterium sp. B35-04]KAF2415208.1 hypothetical protein B1729_00670 [Microbacterium sp. B35-04]
MPQLLGRDAVIKRVAAAVDRALGAGGGTIVASGPAGVGTTAVVDEALRPLRARVDAASAALPETVPTSSPDAVSAAPPLAAGAPPGASGRMGPASIWWIDDVQRMPRAEVERLREAAATRVVVVSGRRPLGSAAGLVRDAVRGDPAAVVDVEPLPPEDALAAVGARDIDAARACGGRLRLLGVWSGAMSAPDAKGGRPAVPGGVPGPGGAGRPPAGDPVPTAVSAVVEDLLADLPPDARAMCEVIAIGGPAPRIAAIEQVLQIDGFDDVLAGLVDAGLIEIDGVRVRSAVPVCTVVVAAHAGAARAAGLRAAYAEALAGLPGVDPRETAEHVRLVADRLPRDFSIAVLRASAERRLAASDPDGAVADLEVAAALAESAVDGGTPADRVRAFETLFAHAVARYFAGPLEEAEVLLRRAERLADVATPAQRDELHLYRIYLRADRGTPAATPLTVGVYDTPDHRAAMAVRHLFLADRGDDLVETDAVCAVLVGFDGDDATPTGRGAAALGRSVRASIAGDLELAENQAAQGFAVAGDAAPELAGALLRELIRLCTLRGDLEAAQRYAATPFDGRVPRAVEASVVVQRAAVATMRGDLIAATENAERALTMTRAAPVPRGLVRCAAWVALLSAMRGDVARARSLVAEAGRIFPLEGNLLLATIVQLARAQLALRDGGSMPPSFEFRMERTEGPSRLLLPMLSARLALQHGDDAVLDLALAELERLATSPPAAALAQRVRALRLVPTRGRRDAIEALDDSATTLAGLGFAGLAAETRLEWAELAAERGEASARDAVLELVPYFDTQGLDDWGDRARRLARTIGVRIGGRRGGAGELTRRESEVVDLVVAGLSNAEIARRLFLSERTVETHLQHVYRRLGVESRLALVQRWAAGADGQAAS